MTQEPIYTASIYIAAMIIIALAGLTLGWILFRVGKKEIKDQETFCEQFKKQKDMKTKFNVTKITRYGNGGGGEVTLKPVLKSTEDMTGMIELNLTPEQLDVFKEMGEFDVTIERAEE